MIDSNMKAQLQQYLALLENPIELTMSLDDSSASAGIRDLLNELAAISSKITVKEAQLARSPSFTVARPGEAARIEFAGLPTGHEFTSLILALLQVGGRAPKISDELIEQIKGLDLDLTVETYISLSCQICPEVVQAFNIMAVLNPGVKHAMIDGGLFQDEINDRQIMAVPTVYVNGEQFSQGRVELEEIIAKLDTSSAAKAAEKLNAKDTFDVLVVGGGPSGAAAAVYAARKGIKTGVLAERFGGQVLDTMAIENFISVPETEGPKLAAALETHVRAYDVDIMNLQRAETLRRNEAGLIEVGLANGAQLTSKTVILSTGARWREMNVPGEKEYRGRGVAYCPHCDGPLFKGKRVAVIGGGNSGIEAAIDLAGIVAEVTVLEFSDVLRADAVLQTKAASLPNVKIVTMAQTTEVIGDGNKVTGISYTDRETGENFTIALEGIFVQIGLVPNTEWLKNVVELSQRGEIEIDAKGQTSIPGVFASGDCTTVPYKQIIISMGQGATAALAAFDYLIRQ